METLDFSESKKLYFDITFVHHIMVDKWWSHGGDIPHIMVVYLHHGFSSKQDAAKAIHYAQDKRNYVNGSRKI